MQLAHNLSHYISPDAFRKGQVLVVRLTCPILDLWHVEDLFDTVTDLSTGIVADDLVHGSISTNVVHQCCRTPLVTLAKQQERVQVGLSLDLDWTIRDPTGLLWLLDYTQRKCRALVAAINLLS